MRRQPRRSCATSSGVADTGERGASWSPRSSPSSRSSGSDDLAEIGGSYSQSAVVQEEDVTNDGRFRLRRSWRNGRCCGFCFGREVKFFFYMKDLFHTMVHQPWHRLFMIVCLAYASSWLFWATFGWAFLDAHHCIYGHTGVFVDWVFWACETMSTIGYGYLRPTCMATKVMMGFMVCHEVFLDACVFGFIFAKFSASSNRGRSLLLSNTLCGEVHRSGAKKGVTFCFRMVNPRKHPVLHPQLDIYLVDKRPTWLSGLPPNFYKVECESRPPLVFLEYPCIVTCRYEPSLEDSSHPLFDVWLAVSRHAGEDRPVSSVSLAHLSLVAIFTAQEPAQGSDFELRRKWCLDKVRWNHTFAPMITQEELMSPGVHASLPPDAASGNSAAHATPSGGNTRIDLSQLDRLQRLASRRRSRNSLRDTPSAAPSVQAHTDCRSEPISSLPSRPPSEAPGEAREPVTLQEFDIELPRFGSANAIPRFGGDKSSRNSGSPARPVIRPEGQQEAEVVPVLVAEPADEAAHAGEASVEAMPRTTSSIWNIISERRSSRDTGRSVLGFFGGS